MDNAAFSLCSRLLHFKIQVIMIRAARIKPHPASRTGIFTAKIFGDRKRAATSAAKNRVSPSFLLSPDHGVVISQLLVTMDARIKRVAAFEFYCHDIAVSVVMRTLSQFVKTAAAHH